MQPLKDQIASLQKNLQQIAQTADTALETTIVSHEDVQNFQSYEHWAREEIIALKHQARDCNLKLHYFAE